MTFTEALLADRAEAIANRCSSIAIADLFLMSGCVRAETVDRPIPGSQSLVCLHRKSSTNQRSIRHHSMSSDRRAAERPSTDHKPPGNPNRFANDAFTAACSNLRLPSGCFSVTSCGTCVTASS